MKPKLYTFRRCPYAIRARMALVQAGIKIDQIEVSLKDKPAHLLELSSKGTVPVLCVGDQAIDESLDIMRWALNKNDPDQWISRYTSEDHQVTTELIQSNDGDFKGWIDRYKYANRFPEQAPEIYRGHCETYLVQLNNLLQKNRFLLYDEITFVDVAIFPFIRQFAMVDLNWFNTCSYVQLIEWLHIILELPLFKTVMAKRSI